MLICDKPSRIGLHVDDSDGVRMEGKQHGFHVVVVTPDDSHWTGNEHVRDVARTLNRSALVWASGSRKGDRRKADRESAFIRREERR